MAVIPLCTAIDMKRSAAQSVVFYEQLYSVVLGHT